MKNSNQKTPPAQYFRFPLKGGGLRGSFGFTLVELIVVISILAILGTIAFLSFSGYSSKSRDSVRISDIVNTQKGLEIYSVTAGKYPLPDNAVVFTGSTGSIINQGILGDNTSRNIKLSKAITDPLTKENYTYSIFNDGKYYQLASSLENTTSFNLPLPLGEGWGEGKIYADSTSFKTTKVIGNYKIDPSLPSLIIVPTSYNTSSGIFDPNVCFVMDGGINTLSTCTEKKKDMSLKDYDSSLVGYWDMETLSGTMLKDLSGNGNDGVFSGGMVYNNALTGGIVGKALYFSGNLIEIQNNEILNINGTGSQITIIANAIVSNNQLFSNILYKGNIPSVPSSSGRQYALRLNRQNYYFHGTSTSINMIGINQTAYGTPNNSINYIGQYIFIVDSKTSIGKLYVNGIKLREGFYHPSGIRSSTGNLLIGRGEYLVNGMDGIIDDIKIYNRALSDSEILQQAKIAGF